jgi:hypothetical protein
MKMVGRIDANKVEAENGLRDLLAEVQDVIHRV